MTSPSTPGESGHDRPPGTDTEDSSASTSTASERTPEPAEPEEPDESEERRPATGIRWSDAEAGSAPEAPASQAEADPTGEKAPVDDDATPPSGLPVAALPGPGDVVPERTTGTAPTPAPAAAWPHPGYQQGPPTWPQTAPGWAPAAAPPPPATPARDPARRRRIRRIVLAVVLGVVVVAAVVVALLAFLVGPRFARYDVLDPAAVERGVTDVVTRDWHRQITDVRCPDGERVRPGVSFTCSATVDGRPQQVPVDVTAEDGTYEVGQPR